MVSRAGAHAGRGFRYQDAVAANLSILAWGKASPYGLVIPEGEDDVELVSEAGRAFVQVKSRRDHRGPFSLLEVDRYLRKLWDRASNSPDDSYILILEREVAGYTPEPEAVSLERFESLLESMQLSRQAADAPSRTKIWVMANPRGTARQLIEQTKMCTTLEADAYYGAVLRRAGALADDNGMRATGSFLGLSLSDVDSEFDRLSPAFTSARLQTALSRGLCEAVDFSTPLEDAQFFSGVDVQPGHVVAGLLVERVGLREAVTAALADQRSVLLRGPSGAGKSALQWDTAYTLRHSVRWFRVRRLAVDDIADLVALANSCCASVESPVGFLLDNVGAGLIEGWDALAREVAIQPGLRLLASIREEDIYPLAERNKAVEIPVITEEDFAEILWRELCTRGQTDWTNWLEPWSSSKGLLLEYAHILTQGNRLEKTLHQQVAARATEPSRHIELEVLNICAAITSLGARVDTTKLTSVLSYSGIEIATSLPRLVNEHLLRDLGDGSLAGVHELRSKHLWEATQEVSLRTEAKIFETALDAVWEADVGIFLSRVLERHPSAEEVMLDSAAAKVSRQLSPRLLTAVFNGLGGRQISQVIESWLDSDEVAGIPVSLLSFVVLFGSAGIELPEPFASGPVAPAIRLMRELKNRSAESNLRGRLLRRLPERDLEFILRSANDLALLSALLGALVGQSIVPSLKEALLKLTPDLLHSDLTQVKDVLGTAYLLDPEVARRWVTRAGASALLARVGTEIPWATPARTLEVEEGHAAAADIRAAPSRYQADTHGDVVSLCELLLALCPTADIAISRAIAADGELLGFNGVWIADKKIPRENLPPASLPNWNRRWKDAINSKLTPPSYGTYLCEMAQAVEKLYSSLALLMDGFLRGIVDQKALTRLNEVNDFARGVPAPSIPSFASAERRLSDKQEASKLQQVVFDGSSSLVRRFNELPKGAAAYMGWSGDLLKRILASISDEPWSLAGQGTEAPKTLNKLAELVSDMRSLAGESILLDRTPIVTHRKQFAQPGQALSQARQAVRKRLKFRTLEIERELKKSFNDLGRNAQVFVKPSSGDMPVWPLVDVLVAITLDKIHDWPMAMLSGWRDWRALVPTGCTLTAMPLVNGRAVTMCAVGGLETAYPAEEAAQDWIKYTKFKQAPDVASRLWSAFLEAAMDVAILEAQGFGESGRPDVERIARSDARARLDSTRESLAARVPELLLSMSSTIVDLVNTQPKALLDAQLSLLRNDMDQVVEVLTDAQYACYSVDLEGAPIPS